MEATRCLLGRHVVNVVNASSLVITYQIINVYICTRICTFCTHLGDAKRIKMPDTAQMLVSTKHGSTLAGICKDLSWGPLQFHIFIML